MKERATATPAIDHGLAGRFAIDEDDDGIAARSIEVRRL
jgi:hypothetical protein